MVTLPLTVVAVAVGLLGAAAVFAGHRRGASAGASAGRGVGVLVVAGGIVLVAASGVVVAGGLRMFGVIHLAYLLGTVSVPLVGVAVAAVSWRGGAGARWPAVAAVVLLLPAPLGIYATHVEPFWLRVDHIAVVVPEERAGRDPVRIGVLADLQTNQVGDYEHEAVTRLLAAEPDLILLPGDLFHGDESEWRRELEPMRELLRRLDAPHGVFFVQGDADPPIWTERILEGSSIQVLDRDVVELEVGDRRIRLGGHTLHPSGPDADHVRAELQATDDPDVITILLAHRPDTVLYLPPRSRVDLTVAGHTHGGQIVIPGFGPPVTLSDVPRHVARGGLHAVDGNPIYVSPGVGMERGDAPQVRLFSRPAIGILTLT
jgi:predicted MPP superfamily phosphohydrolase